MSYPLIYKISPRPAWEVARNAGAFTGSAHDVRDGYIHMSTAEQVAETLARHYRGLDDLVLAAVDPVRLPAGTLRWEPSRGGALFPHIYGALPMTAVTAEHALTLDDQGLHVLPPELKTA